MVQRTLKVDMRNDTPKELHTTIISSVVRKGKLKINVLEKKKRTLINPKLIKICDLLQLLVIGDKIKEKFIYITRFYFEKIKPNL